MSVLAVFVGGAIGSAARFLMSVGIARRVQDGFPWPTLVVNVSGCALLGAVVPLLGAANASAGVVAFVTIGLLGAFTTFSSFSYEALLLIQGGRTRAAVGYIAASVLLGLSALALSAAIMVRIVGPPGWG